MRTVVGLLLFTAVVFGLRFAVRGGGEQTGETFIGRAPEPPSETRTGPEWVVIDIDGVPPGAHVRLDGLPGATVPLRVRRGSHHVVEIQAPGYVDRRLDVDGDENHRVRADMRPLLGTGQTH